ncbi:hypothetical protein MBLNU230_g1415t1 [Neophaeotheca triangularis]
MPRRRRPARPGALADLSPLRVAKQILLLQLSYYGVALVLIVFTTFVAGRDPNAGLLFDWHNVRSDVTTGWTLGLCWMLDGVLTVIPILLLIARSKLVPDFALTIHFIHLLVTSLYTRSLPTNLYWWLLQFASAGLMIALGMWACQWRELKPMSFGGNKNGAAAASQQPRTSGERGKEDSEGGMNGAVGRRSGEMAGEYEMGNMARKEPV